MQTTPGTTEHHDDILVVDDTPANLLLLTGVLQREGYGVRPVNNGKTALRAAHARTPDLILLDIDMPELNGFEVCRALKADPTLAEVPVIFVSAKIEVEDKLQGFEVGGVDYVTKPFFIEEVLARVASHLQIARMKAALERANLELRARNHELKLERARSKHLLRNVLPQQIVQDFEERGSTQPRQHEQASVLFADLVGFTARAAELGPQRLVTELSSIFSAFDQITEALGVERIKTIGDAYMAAAGVPIAAEDHADRLLRTAQAMLDWLERRNERVLAEEPGMIWQLRVGVHSGPVIAAVVGTRRYLYDIFGETVNLACRLEQAGEPGRINTSAQTRALVGDSWRFEARGERAVKGAGDLAMFFVEPREG